MALGRAVSHGRGDVLVASSKSVQPPAVDDRTHGQPLDVRLQDAWSISVGRSPILSPGRTIYESGLWLKDPHSPFLLSTLDSPDSRSYPLFRYNPLHR